MSDERKCDCGMPLNNDMECSCEPGICIHCCKCPADCECGCKEKATKDKSIEE